MTTQAIEAFKRDLDGELGVDNLLPGHVDVEKFKSAALIAMQTVHRLDQATPQSVMRAVRQAAEDGLMPDGREGAIVVRKNKANNSLEAQWQPMTYGIRKRALEIAGIVITADVVHENDEFIFESGDHPRLVHTRPKLGTPRGKGIGAYAIFRRGDEILHREVMEASEIEQIRQSSQQPDAAHWTKFWMEGWKKTVARRGIKTVPTVPELERIVKRIDEDYPQYDRRPSLTVVHGKDEPKKLPPAPPAPKAPGDTAPKPKAPPAPPKPSNGKVKAPPAPPKPATPVEDAQVVEQMSPGEQDVWVINFLDELRTYEGEARQEFWDGNRDVIDGLSPENKRKCAAALAGIA